MAIIKKFRIKSFKQKKPILKLESVSLSFGSRQILENINFEINKGEIFGNFNLSWTIKHGSRFVPRYGRSTARDIFIRYVVHFQGKNGVRQHLRIQSDGMYRGLLHNQSAEQARPVRRAIQLY